MQKNLGVCKNYYFLEFFYEVRELKVQYFIYNLGLGYF